MIKKSFRKNGYLIIDDQSISNKKLKENYFLINNYCKGGGDIYTLKKEYFKSLGFTYPLYYTGH